MPVQWTQLKLIKSFFSAAYQTQSCLDVSPEYLLQVPSLEEGLGSVILSSWLLVSLSTLWAALMPTPAFEDKPALNANGLDPGLGRFLCCMSSEALLEGEGSVPAA